MAEQITPRVGQFMPNGYRNISISELSPLKEARQWMVNRNRRSRGVMGAENCQGLLQILGTTKTAGFESQLWFEPVPGGSP